jgi:hypothetical protein
VDTHDRTPCRHARLVRLVKGHRLALQILPEGKLLATNVRDRPQDGVHLMHPIPSAGRHGQVVVELRPRAEAVFAGETLDRLSLQGVDARIARERSYCHRGTPCCWSTVLRQTHTARILLSQGRRDLVFSTIRDREGTRRRASVTEAAGCGRPGHANGEDGVDPRPGQVHSGRVANGVRRDPEVLDGGIAGGGALDCDAQLLDSGAAHVSTVPVGDPVDVASIEHHNVDCSAGVLRLNSPKGHRELELRAWPPQ